MPDIACVRPAPGTTFTQAMRPDARHAASAMKDALCSSVTRTERTEGDDASASQSSMLCVPGIPNASTIPSSSRARTTSSAPVRFVDARPGAPRSAPASSRMRSAARSASAMTVRYGLISSEFGNRLESATKRPGRPCTRPQESVTESAGDAPIPQPPIRCAAETEIRPVRKFRSWMRSPIAPASARSRSGGSAEGAWTRTAPAAKKIRAAARVAFTSDATVSFVKE